MSTRARIGLRRPLGNEQTAARFRRFRRWTIRRHHDDRQPPPLEVERDLVDLSVARDDDRRLLKNRGIQRAANPRLEPAVDVGQRQWPRRCRAPRIERTIELHRPGRQRARLVAAQNVDAAEVLNRGQALDDHLRPRHAHRSAAQRHGADHREKFRREAHAQRDGEQQRFERVVLEDNADHEDEQHQHDRRSQDQQAESVQPVFEFGFWCACPQPGRDVAEHRLRARRQGHRRARAAHDRGAEKHQIRGVGAGRAARTRWCVRRRDSLVGRQRLARQHRLLNGEIARLEKSAVRRHQIAGRQPDEIAGHDRPDRDFLPIGARNHPDRGGQRRPATPRAARPDRCRLHDARRGGSRGRHARGARVPRADSPHVDRRRDAKNRWPDARPQHGCRTAGHACC